MVAWRLYSDNIGAFKYFLSEFKFVTKIKVFITSKCFCSRFSFLVTLASCGERILCDIPCVTRMTLGMPSQLSMWSARDSGSGIDRCFVP